MNVRKGGNWAIYHWSDFITSKMASGLYSCFLFVCFLNKIEKQLSTPRKYEVAWHIRLTRRYRYWDSPDNSGQVVYHFVKILRTCCDRLQDFEDDIANKSLQHHCLAKLDSSGLERLQIRPDTDVDLICLEAVKVGYDDRKAARS